MKIRYVFGGIFAVVGLFLLAAALNLGGLALNAELAPWIGEKKQVIKTNDVNYRIPAYDHFFNLCASIQAREDQIDNMQLLDDNDPTKSTNIVGLQNLRQSDIRQYNADATKEGTLGQFRASNLPYYIDPAAYTGENKTSCSV